MTFSEPQPRFTRITAETYGGIVREDPDDEPDELETTVSDEDRLYFDEAEVLLTRLFEVKHLNPNTRAWAFTLNSDDHPTLEYPRSGLDWLWHDLIPADPLRAVRLLKLHLGWVGPEPPDPAYPCSEWLSLALALARSGDKEAGARSLRVALRVIPATSVFTFTYLVSGYMADIFDEIGDPSAAALAREIREILDEYKPSPVLQEPQRTNVATFLETWSPSPQPNSATMSVLRGRIRLADALGDISFADLVESEEQRRHHLIDVATTAPTEDVVIRALSDLPNDDRPETKMILEAARARMSDAPRVAFRLAERAARHDPQALEVLFQAALADGGDAGDYYGAAEAVSPRLPHLLVLLARLDVKRGDLAAARDHLIAAKRAGAPLLALTLQDRDLGPLIIGDDTLRGLFDEPVHWRRGDREVGEADVIMFWWSLPLEQAGPHMVKLFDWFIERYAENLKWGTTGLHATTYKPVTKALITRARNTMAGEANKKELSAMTLRDTNFRDGVPGWSVRTLGNQEPGRCVLKVTAPSGGFGDGEALIETVRELAELAGPFAAGYSDVAISFDMSGSHCYEDAHYMYFGLHPGLDLMSEDVAWDAFLGPVDCPGARWAVALGDKLVPHVTLPEDLVYAWVGDSVVLRAGTAPTRGSLLRPQEPWLDQRRRLARALEPITTFDNQPHGYPEALGSWSRRWLQ